MAPRPWDEEMRGPMYKLLLVSDKQDVRELYTNFSDWENLGFEQPTVALDAQDGIDKLSKNRYDAISWLLSVCEGKKFFAYLSRRPEMLGVQTARNEETLRREISSARRTLSSRDAFRQMKQVDDVTRAMQGEFFRDLLRGAAYDQEKIDERCRSLGMKEFDANVPVCLASFRLPQGDYFLAEVWRYGRDRLENALKNIFENGGDDLHCVLLIINPHHMRLLAVPNGPMKKEDVHEAVVQHLERCRASLEAYFELNLDVKRIVAYDSVYALGKENALRTAH